MTARNRYNFSGRHAVITGGAAGIGLAIATRLIEGGATVSLWDRDAQALDKARSTLGAQHARVEQVDVGDENSVQSARSEEHTSELQSLMRISYAVFCLKKK